MIIGQSNRHYASHAEFYAATYGQTIVESRKVRAASATLLFCRKGAGDFSGAATPDLVVCVQKDTRSPGLIDLGAGAFRTSPISRRGIVVPVGAATRIHAEQPHDMFAIGIPFRNLQALMPDALPASGDFGRLHTREFNDPFAYALIERLWIESNADNPCGQLFAEGALVALAAILLRLSDGPAQPAVAKGGLAPWQVRRATEVLQTQSSEQLSLTMLAREVGLSPFHFARAFKQSIGVPPHRYRTRLRLEKACHLLEMTNASVTDIAFAVGYETSQALARVFGREFGTTPTAWRQDRRR